ncbi:MAG TPA: septum formation protein Maf [Acholeplasmataceae bacterium]|nr:septum formation protein Maf [Acholeplasmataceae bacterium]
MMRIILGSGSARRKELMELLGYDFLVHIPRVEEKLSSYQDPLDYAEKLALKKGTATVSVYPDDLVICADTIVVAGEKILEKPKDKEDARRMMENLSGRDHMVITGVFINFRNYRKVFAEKTIVKIDKLSPEEIEAYISTKEPYDKSGGYAIQGIFGKHVRGIKGDFYNVMGLPINCVYREIKRIENKYGIIFPKNKKPV